MASMTSSLTVRTSPLRCMLNANTAPPTKQYAMALPGRRQLISLVTATTVLKALEMPSKAEDIGLFGLRKKLKKVEEEAEELVKEGFEATDKGIVAAEKGIEAVEKGLVTAEMAAEEKIESTPSFGGLAQAGAVVGAELVGVLVAGAVVNGILGPEAQKS